MGNKIIPSGATFGSFNNSEGNAYAPMLPFCETVINPWPQNTGPSFLFPPLKITSPLKETPAKFVRLLFVAAGTGTTFMQGPELFREKGRTKVLPDCVN